MNNKTPCSSDENTIREENQSQKGAEPVKNEARPAKFAHILRRTITSESFLEKAILLLLTALLSGLIVPMIITSLQASRSRSESVLQAQNKFYEDMADTLLTYETLALDVSWFKGGEAKSEALFEQAFNRYNQRTVELVAKWRVQIAKARTLVSKELGVKLGTLLNTVFTEQDTPINELHSINASSGDWALQHAKNKALAADITSFVGEVATELGLTKEALR